MLYTKFFFLCRADQCQLYITTITTHTKLLKSPQSPRKPSCSAKRAAHFWACCHDQLKPRGKAYICSFPPGGVSRI